MCAINKKSIDRDLLCTGECQYCLMYQSVICSGSYTLILLNFKTIQTLSACATWHFIIPATKEPQIKKNIPTKH